MWTIFFSLLVVVALSSSHCPLTSRNSLLTCFSQHVDVDHDGKLNRYEVGNVTEYMFFDVCDINGDEFLDLNDWNDPFACCLERNCIYSVCHFCETHFNWTAA